MRNFERYASVYDLIYSAKDYAGEATFVLSQLRKIFPEGNSLLELGCGTGGHAGQFLKEGLKIHAIDRSVEMIQLASRKFPHSAGQFEARDIAGLELNRKFDYVVSLFHVFSYQTSDAQIRDFLKALKNHMGQNSVALFDYWYSPAVLQLGTAATTKEFTSGNKKIIRTSSPKKLHSSGQYVVSIKIDVFEGSQQVDSFTEEHPMRSFDLSEVKSLCKDAGMSVVYNGAWGTNDAPSENSWSAFTVVKRNIQ